MQKKKKLINLFVLPLMCCILLVCAVSLSAGQCSPMLSGLLSEAFVLTFGSLISNEQQITVILKRKKDTDACHDADKGQLDPFRTFESIKTF